MLVTSDKLSVDMCAIVTEIRLCKLLHIVYTVFLDILVQVNVC